MKTNKLVFFTLVFSRGLTTSHIAELKFYEMLHRRH